MTFVVIEAGQLNISDTCRSAKFNGINFNYAQFIGNPSIALNAKKQNMMLGSWTVNKDEDFDKLVAQGVEFITTNFPDRYLTIKKAPR